jgi:hypothetical protein
MEKRRLSKVSTTQKETIEYDEQFLEDWNTFCDTKGYVKRQAAHACRIAFMEFSADYREQMMREMLEHLNSSRRKSSRAG